MNLADEMENIPRSISEAPLGTPMLEWWAEEYDHVFIILSPFFRVEGYSPETAAFGPVHVGRETIGDILDWIKNPVSRPNEAPDNFEEIIKQNGEVVHWCDVQSAIGIEDPLAFRRACWLWVIASPDADEYSEIVKKLEAYCRKHGIYKPEEDQLPVILESVVGRYLMALGVDDVTIYSEFRDKKMNVPIKAFSSEQAVVEIPTEKTCAIVSGKPKLMFCWSFDDTYGFLCISEEARLLADPAEFFEGQYAGVDTYCDWLNPVDVFERKPPRKTN